MAESILNKTTALKGSDFRGRARRPRRNWTREAKSQVVAAMLSPGANVSEIARQHEISRQHLYLWRKAALAGELALPAHCEATQARIVVAEGPAHRAEEDETAPAIEIEASGFVVRVRPGVDLGLLADVMQALRTLA
jgi:transposase